MMYFFPAGGGGIGTPAVAANSSKFAGRFLWPTIQRIKFRFISPRSGSLGAAAGCVETWVAGRD